MKSLSLSLLALTLFSAGALAVTNTYQLTSETDVPSLYQQTLPDFWRQHAVEGEFKGKDGVTIRYAALRQAKVERAILIVNGRVESYLKYQELAWDLWRQGYSLYLIDHRGQGMSGRMLNDPQKGYVDQFDDYVVESQAISRPYHHGGPTCQAVPAGPLHGRRHLGPLSGTLAR